MQATPAQIAGVLIRDFLANACIVWYFAFFARIWYRVPVKPRRGVVCMMIAFLAHCVTHYLLGQAAPAFIVTGGMLILVAQILWRPLGGIRFWKCFAFCALTEYAAEFIFTFTSWRLFSEPFLMPLGRAQVYAYAPEITPMFIIFFVLLLGVPLSISKLFIDLRENRSRVHSGRAYLLRLFALSLFVFGLLALFAYNGNILVRNNGTLEDTVDTVRGNLPTFLAYAIAIALLLFYLWQNLQQYLLYLNNQSLQDKNDAYQRVLDGTREFRHNISNMLYGFEGSSCRRT